MYTLGSWATRRAARSQVSSAARSQRNNCSSKLRAINPPSPVKKAFLEPQNLLI